MADATAGRETETDSAGRQLATQEAGTDPAGIAAAVLIARIRAQGYASAVAPAAVKAAAAAAAASVDRKLVEISDPGRGQVFVLGWADGAAPSPDQHPSAPPRRLAAVPSLVFAVCLAAAWPDATADPYPGRPFLLERVLSACAGLGADRRHIAPALTRTLPDTGLITVTGPGAWLGPAAAALPAITWAALRRDHDRLPHSALASQEASGLDEPDGSPAFHVIPGPIAGPISYLETAVRAAVTALESAQTPVARADLAWLADPAIRRTVEVALDRIGRVLVPLPDGRWTTGFPDAVTQALAAEHSGTLTRTQRAVLALVLLRTVAIPRAQGKHEDDGWGYAEHPATTDDLYANRRLTRVEIAEALRGLRAAGYVATAPTGGYIPGPALARLSQAGREVLWEDLLLLARPGGYMAERIRARRRRSAPVSIAHSETPTRPSGDAP
jgi:hypothetical protein